MTLGRAPNVTSSALPRGAVRGSSAGPQVAAAQGPIEERAEALAKARSDAIDSAIQAEKDARKKKKPPVKVLLLGQSESGKSTTLKSESLSVLLAAWGDTDCAYMCFFSEKKILRCSYDTGDLTSNFGWHISL